MTDPQAAPASWGEPRSKTVTWYDPLAGAAHGAALSGRDYLQAMAAGELPFPPMAAHFGMRITDVADGEVTFKATPDESTYNPVGLVHGGLVCTLLDSALGCAVLSTLPAGFAFTSVEIKVSYLRAVTGASGELTAVGGVTKRGSRITFAEGDVRDGAGKLVATASSSCLILPALG